MGGRTFDCLEAVINRYKTEQIVEGHTLGHYIKRVRERMLLCNSVMSFMALSFAVLNFRCISCDTTE